MPFERHNFPRSACIKAFCRILSSPSRDGTRSLSNHCWGDGETEDKFGPDSAAGKTARESAKSFKIVFPVVMTSKGRNCAFRRPHPLTLIRHLTCSNEAPVFISQQGDRWICQNFRCRCEFVVVKPCVVTSGSNARCCCGSEMTRQYVAPSVRKMDAGDAEIFLQDGKVSLEPDSEPSK